MLNPENFMQLGGTAVVAIAAFWSITQIFKMKKQPLNGVGKAILEQLKEQNLNHLHDISTQMNKICDNINEGNNRLIDAINNGNQKMIEILGRIEGKISR